MPSCTVFSLLWRRYTAKFPATAQDHPVLGKWLSFVLGSLLLLVSVAVYQTTWQNAMRAIFNQTEMQANIVSICGLAGAHSFLPAGIMYEVFNTQMIVTVGGLLSVFGYTVLGLGASRWQTEFTCNLWIVPTVYFNIGFAHTFLYMTGLLANVENFPPKHHGIVIGTLDAMLSAGSVLFAVIYNTAFTDGYTAIGEESEQNISGYFLFVGIAIAVVSTLAFLFVGKVHGDNQRTSLSHEVELEPLFDTGSTEAELTQEIPPPSVFSEYPFTELSLSKTIFRPSYWLVTLQLALSGSLQDVYHANIPTYLRSLDMNDYNLMLTSLYPIVQIISKIASGSISDFLLRRFQIPRANTLVLTYIIQTTSLTISTGFPEYLSVQVITCASISIAAGTTWCLTPTLISELFGSRHLGANWGLCPIFTVIVIIPLSTVYSIIYQMAIPNQSEIYCYGGHCFFWSYILFAVCSFFSLLASLGLLKTMRYNAKQRRNVT